MTNIALLPGDGVGTEILEGPVAFLQRLAAEGEPITITGPMPFGSSGWRQTGEVLPAETVDACRKADVILAGAVGTHPGVSYEECPHPEAALIGLRHMFDLRISVRTVWVPGAADVTIVRNITDGAYVEQSQRTESDGTSAAIDQIHLLPERVREVLELAADYAHAHPGRRYVSVDKPSVFATSRLWRATAKAVALDRDVAFEHLYVDRAAYELVKYDELPAVIATEGIFGDILSDIVGARAGSPALCGSATINPDRKFGSGATGLFEPAHGTAPGRTGTRTCNPTGAWLALGALLDWCPDLQPHELGADIRTALADVFASGVRTTDLAGPDTPAVDMDEFNRLILKSLEAHRG
jgi:3-isopropylmalate dehydrogenase